MLGVTIFLYTTPICPLRRPVLHRGGSGGEGGATQSLGIPFCSDNKYLLSSTLCLENVLDTGYLVTNETEIVHSLSNPK